MRITAVAASLIFVPTVLAAQESGWYSLHTNPATYIDTTTIHTRIDNTVRIHLRVDEPHPRLVDPNTPHGPTYERALFDEEIDCAQKASRIWSVTLYAHDGHVVAFHDYPVPTGWQHPAKKSADKTVVDKTCSTIRYFRP